MKSNNHKQLLRELNACKDALEWYDDRDSEQAWNECERGDWMLWVAAKMEIDRSTVVKTACDCAEQALEHIPEGEDRPIKAIEAARKWAKEPTEVNRQLAADAAYAAADAAYAAADAASADAAYYAADAAYYAYAAGNVAAYAAYAVSFAADTAGRIESLKQSAQIVRQTIPWSIIKQAIDRVEKTT